MKIISETQRAHGRRMVIDLNPDETVSVLRADGYYRLGYPVEDIVGEHVLSGATRVVWCSVEQKWVDAS